MTPASPSIAVGTTQQFTATGLFSDNSTENITNQVTWASATPSVATISTTGLATALATGTSSITASLSGITGSTMLTVTPPLSLQSITVTPANPSIAVGTTEQFTAIGTFSDNSTEILTSQVTWASATPSVATISSHGSGHGLEMGSSSITASLNGVTGAAMLTVTPPSAPVTDLTKTSLTVTPRTSRQGQRVTLTATVKIIDAKGFTATGTVNFSEGSTFLGFGSLNRGRVIFRTSSLPVGHYAILATYVPNTARLERSSHTFTVLVQAPRPKPKRR